MSENGPLPEHLRCKRTDGRRWRCNRRVLEDKKLCEIHHIQGKHRQNRTKVPESLKIQRRVKKTRNEVVLGAELGEKERKIETLGRKLKKKRKMEGESGGLDQNMKKVKVKKGDLSLELIRMVLKREVEKMAKMPSRRKKKKRLVMVEERGEGDESGSNSEAELMRDLPNGLMAISPAKCFGNVGSSGSGGGVSCSSPPLRDVKIGGGGGENGGVSRRCFRSKNIEPLPVGTLQVVPYKDDLVRLRKGKRKKCHWCRRSGLKGLIECSSCLKEFYCLDCIKEQYSNMLEEVKIACPVCRGTCGCKVCSAIQCADIECKRSFKDESKVEKVLHFHYLICILLPVLKQINQDQSIELEIEAKVKGRKSSEVQVHRADASCNKQPYCNNCQNSIMDFHRSCLECSFKVCLSCSRDIFHGSLSGSVKAHLCKCPDRRKFCTNGKQVLEMKPLWNSKQKYGIEYFESPKLSSRGKLLNGNGGIPCPPTEYGGCGDGLLVLSSVYPSSWIKELEVSAEEIVGCYEVPEALDVYSHCSLCLGIDHEAGEIEQLQRAARREDSFDNLLYYPTVMEIHKDNLEHFQKHWGKGQPVIIRNVLQSQSDLSWDPIVMFCTYLKNSIAKTEEQANDCLDWFEVEMGMKHLFMGTFKGQNQRNMWQERLKLKGWLSSHVFQEHFPAHYAELLHALPLPEYMNPVSGVLNIAAELSQEILKPELGPSLYISYGCGENLLQGDSVMKLRYDSYDQVNISVHATDVPVSTEQLNYIRKLMKKQKEQNSLGEKTVLDERNIEKLGLHEMVGEEMQLHKKVARVSWFSAATHDDRKLSCKERDAFLDGEQDTDSDSDSDTDTDTEVSKFFFGPVKSSRTSENRKYGSNHVDISNCFVKEKIAESCAAQWDVFRRQDVPILKEYLRRHSNELFSDTYGFRKRMNHLILDQNFFLDTRHKIRLKEEFNIEPWTFYQHVGEAVIIPAGCPYQVRSFKSCVNVVLDFVSPENVAECIQVIDELRQLPHNHKAKVDSLEVKKMALHSISKAIKEFRELTCAETTSTEQKESFKD